MALSVFDAGVSLHFLALKMIVQIMRDNEKIKIKKLN